MNQIFYTQCPIGYGLGASNGFQIKRLSPGYPVTSDFRHLGMRAYVAGTRTLAPPTLRYRRGEGGVAEIAWLTPRSHEYDTERGLWGRPGGHFAHGLRIEDAELSALADWPAGLYDRPLWTRSDREPSRGAPPPALSLSAADLRCPPTFDSVVHLTDGENPDRLARLLTATATAVREGRTLFLIDAPERLPDRIALLTFAFPPPWRSSITFSTYHDRPEELPGFRIQGTIPAVRPNRLALLSQGIIADLERGTFEPSFEPARWSLTMAGWLARQGAVESRLWTELASLLQRAGAGKAIEEIWAEDWMENLFATHAVLRGASTPPASSAEWQSLGVLTDWARSARLSKPAAKVRGASWWTEHIADDPEARDALLIHFTLPEAWSGGSHDSEWGTTFARLIQPCGPLEQRSLIQRALGAIPESSRAGFLRAMVREWPIDTVEGILRWLKSVPGLEPTLLLPSEVRGAVDAVFNEGRTVLLTDVLQRALDAPNALVATLDALEAEASERPEARASLAVPLGDVLENAKPAALAEAQRWALLQGEAAETWIGPYLRRVFANPMHRADWPAIRDRTPSELRPVLARCVLRVAASPTMQEAFPWGVEEILLKLPESERPEDPAWPGLYLERSPSDIDLLDRLFDTGDHPRLLLDWLKRAHKRGELAEGMVDRLKNINAIQRALRSGNTAGLIHVDFAAIPPRDRPSFLNRLVSRLETATVDSVMVFLGWCRDAWPGAFAPGEPGLRGFAAAIADSQVLAASRRTPVAWWNTLREILEDLRLEGPGGQGFEPDSLASEIVAATSERLSERSGRWEFRRSVLQQDPGWKTLAGDIRQELARGDRTGLLAMFRRWDDTLDKGAWTSRFFELFLNVAGEDLLASIVLDKADSLRGLNLTWWSSHQIPGASSDVRDRFVRTVPIAPLGQGLLSSVERWLFPITRQVSPQERSDLVSLEASDGPRSTQSSRDTTILSPFGRVRWRCIEALSEFVEGDVILSKARWTTLLDSKVAPRLDQLDEGDRYRFVAWLIMKSDPIEIELDILPIPRLAEWLWKHGASGASRIETSWAAELSELVEVPHEVRRDREPIVLALCDRIAHLDFQFREGARKLGGAGSP